MEVFCIKSSRQKGQDAASLSVLVAATAGISILQDGCSLPIQLAHEYGNRFCAPARGLGGGKDGKVSPNM